MRELYLHGAVSTLEHIPGPGTSAWAVVSNVHHWTENALRILTEIRSKKCGKIVVPLIDMTILHN